MSRVENSVFVVPKDRIFMLPTKEIGHVTMVDHIGEHLSAYC